MRFHPIALTVLLAAGCTAQNDDAANAPPVAENPAPAPASSTPAAPVEPAPAPEPAPEPEPESSPATATVPPEFRGDYAADAVACTSPGHVTRLTIGASRIEFHESAGGITAVERDGDRIDITARVTGEGETREATYSFRLSDDGRTLTDTAHGMARQRCDSALS